MRRATSLLLGYAANVISCFCVDLDHFPCRDEERHLDDSTRFDSSRLRDVTGSCVTLQLMSQGWSQTGAAGQLTVSVAKRRSQSPVSSVQYAPKAQSPACSTTGLCQMHIRPLNSLQVCLAMPNDCLKSPKNMRRATRIARCVRTVTLTPGSVSVILSSRLLGISTPMHAPLYIITPTVRPSFRKRFHSSSLGTLRKSHIGSRP